MYIILIIIFLLLPLGVAWFIGRHRKIGFWGSLLFSIILTPFIGFIITIASAVKNPVGCTWCGNEDNEVEYCGLCGKNRDGEIKPGFKKI